MAAGKVSTQAISRLRTVAICRPEPLAAMVPATPDDKMCVVETGNPQTSAAAIVRVVLEHQREHESQWAAIVSVAGKIGCTPETLRIWVRRVEVDADLRDLGHALGPQQALGLNAVRAHRGRIHHYLRRHEASALLDRHARRRPGLQAPV